jgi:hypothetical protein
VGALQLGLCGNSVAQRLTRAMGVNLGVKKLACCYGTIRFITAVTFHAIYSQTLPPNFRFNVRP